MVGRLFELCQPSAAYREAWDGSHPAAKPRCVHLGRVIGAVQCEGCHGRTFLKTFECAVHVTCTIAKEIPGHAMCAKCPDYRPEEPANAAAAADPG